MATGFESQLYRPVESASETGSALTSESVIDRHSHFNGLYRTARDLRIEGSAEGQIECDGTVTVAPQARVAATIRARNVTIAGCAEGEIVCQERFTIDPTGEMRGRVQAASLVVEEGAFFEGEFQMAESVSQPGADSSESPPAMTASDEPFWSRDLLSDAEFRLSESLADRDILAPETSEDERLDEE